MKRVGVVALCLLLILSVAGCHKDGRMGSDDSGDNGISDPAEGGDFPQSVRIPVDGVLAKPERDWAAIIVMDNSSAVKLLDSEDASQVYRILSEMEAEVVLTPFHNEGQFSDPLFTIMIEYADDPGTGEVIYSTETGRYFYRFTNSVGNQGDKGYVGGSSEELYTVLKAYFQE